MTEERRLTTSRFGRLAMLGRLAGGIATGAISEGARQLASGQRPTLGGVMLTPANGDRLARRLAEMRGAAMKVGQLLSMDSGEVLPPELSAVLARLREDAHAMPLGQVAEVLNTAWGKGWQEQFQRFVFKPIAAASIGQVHEAQLKDGRRLAIKLQYPGIRESIDADVDNVATLLNTFRILPQGLDIDPLLAEAKRQLHAEADYELEAAALREFGERLAGDARFEVPGVIEALSNKDVLTMTFCDGEPIEDLDTASQGVRDRVAADLVELALRETFGWGLVQTDPNFANYRYNADSGKVALLDFGATRRYDIAKRTALNGLMRACISGDDASVAEAAADVGYLGTDDGPIYRKAIVSLLRMATEPARSPTYRFGGTDLAQRMSATVIDLRANQAHGRLPPPDVLFLHRKIGGLYLLLSRLRATVEIPALYDRVSPAAPQAAPTLLKATG